MTARTSNKADTTRKENAPVHERSKVDLLVDKRLGERVLHVRFDVELLRAVRIFHGDEHFRVKVRYIAAAA